MSTLYSDVSSLPSLYLSVRSSDDRPGFNEFPSGTLHFLRDASDGWAPFSPSRGPPSDPRRMVGLDLLGVTSFSGPQDSPLLFSLGVRSRDDSWSSLSLRRTQTLYLTAPSGAIFRPRFPRTGGGMPIQCGVCLAKKFLSRRRWRLLASV